MNSCADVGFCLFTDNYLKFQVHRDSSYTIVIILHNTKDALLVFVKGSRMVADKRSVRRNVQYCMYLY